MTIGISLLLVTLGLGLLAGGGEALVRGAVSIAKEVGLTPAVIGLTVVALGTSLPELVVSVIASLRGQPDIAVGNVVGSNIFNLALTAGLCALLVTLPIHGNVVKLEWPVMFVASAVFMLVARDGVIDRLEAGTFLAALIAFTGYSVWIARQEVQAAELDEFRDEVAVRGIRRGGPELLKAVAAVAIGLVLLVVGGRLLVDGSVRLAELAGISERVIGLTIVAAGTSAPEVATALVAAYRRQTDVAVANLIGSNIFNILGIVGVSGTILPLQVSPTILGTDMWWMLGTAGILFPMMWFGRSLTRRDGLVLLAGYGVYLFYLLR
jgi:cation:H+ antiporter